MKVLLTGASGFIGSQVARCLLERNHQPAIVALPDDPLTRLIDVQNRLEILRTPLEDTDAVRKAVERWKPGACIHLAWYAEPGLYLHSVKNISSLTSSLALFQALIDGGCSRIVGAGTCLEYDTDFGWLREDTPARPESLYAAAKLSCGLLGARLAGSSETSFAWGRIFYPYGLQEDPRRLVPAAIAALSQGKPFEATTGEQIRDYIHVADVASAFCVLAEQRDGGIFNISSGVPVSVRQLLEILGSQFRQPDLLRFGAIPRRAGDPPFICGNNEKLISLGWHPAWTLSEGLADTIRRAETRSYES